MTSPAADPAPGDDLDDRGRHFGRPVDVAARPGVTFAAGSLLAVALVALGPLAGPTLVCASGPLGSATALVPGRASPGACWLRVTPR